MEADDRADRLAALAEACRALVDARAPRRTVAASVAAVAQALFGGTVSSTGYIAGAVLAGLVAQQAGIAAVYPVSAAGCVAGAVIVWVAVARGRHPTTSPELRDQLIVDQADIVHADG